MYSLDIHSGHRNMADTSQVGKCGLYTSFNTKKSNQNNKKRRLWALATTKIAYNTRAIMVLLLLLTITIHKLNFFSHLTHFLSNIFSFYVLVTKAVLMTKYHLIATSLDWVLLIKTTNQTWFLSLHVRKSGFRNLGNFCLWNPEYGIQLKEYANPVTIGIRNPSSRMTRNP